MPQFKVPQNIDMEDRIIAKLSFSQLAYVAFGAIVGYVVLVKLPGAFGYIIGGVFFLFGFSLAVVKIREVPLPKYLLNFLRFTLTPKSRSWEHQPQYEKPIITDQKKKIKKEERTKKKIYSEEELSDVAGVVDSHGYSKLDDE